MVEGIIPFTVNYFAVLLAAVASFAFGALWHSPLGFSAYWQKLMGFKEEDMHNMPLTPVQAMLLGFVAAIIFAYTLAQFIVWTGALDILDAITVGFWIWLGFVVMTLANGWLWEGKTVKLFLFNSAYQFLSILIMSLVLGIWR